MTTALQAAGAQAKPSKWAPIWSDTFFTGLWTQRNPLRDAATPFIYRKFWGATRYESLIDGLNMEMSPHLTLIRRPGETVYNSQTFPPINRFYEFRKFSPETIQLIADTGTAGGLIYDATGPSTQTTIFTKSAHAGEAYFQSIGNTLYWGDGAEEKKYLSNGSVFVVENWGIASNSGAGTFGPDTAGAGADGGGGAAVWSNPSNVTSAVSYATVNTSFSASPSMSSNGYDYETYDPSVSGTQGPQQAQSLGFSIPTYATINGIIVSFTRNVDSTALHVNTTNSVQLLKAGVAVGSTHGPGSNWSATPTVETWGNSTDLWGTTWTPADINNPQFGFQFFYNYLNTSHTTQHAAIDYHLTIQVYYSAGSSGPATSDELIATQFGFGSIPVPSGTQISGVQVSFGASSSGTGSPIVAQLVYAGVPLSGTKTIILPSVATTLTLGASSDLWGLGNLTASTVNDSSFGVQFFAPNGSFGLSSINNVQITLYSTGLPTATPTGSGSFSATTGYRYVYSYYNALDGGTSTSTQPSAAGVGADTAFSNAAYVGVTVQASPDPQVTNILLFRTKDGGSTFFQIPILYPNTTATIHDTTPDAQLNIFSQAPSDLTAPVPGYNNPPPSGLNRPTYHAGVMWGQVGNFLYYSRTPNQAIPGVAVQCFPPSFYFEFPASITRLIPTVYGLIVFLISEIWIIQGTGGSGSPFIPVKFISTLGLQSYDALTENGTLIYFYSSDQRLVSLDPNAGVSEVGFPIGDKLQATFNPLLANVTYHPGGSADQAVYITDGSTNWYRLSPVAAPETGQMFSPVAQPVGGFSTVQSVEQTGGTHALLIGPQTSGPILQRNTSVVTDNGTPYSCFATIGSIVLAPPSQMAALGFIAADVNGPGTNGTAPTVSVLLDDTQGTFSQLINPVNDPPSLPPSTYTVGNRWYFSTGQLPSGAPLPAWCRHLQIKFAWGATATSDELRSYTLVGQHWSENP